MCPKRPVRGSSCLPVLRVVGEETETRVGGRGINRPASQNAGESLQGATPCPIHHAESRPDRQLNRPPLRQGSLRNQPPLSLGDGPLACWVRIDA